MCVCHSDEADANETSGQLGSVFKTAKLGQLIDSGCSGVPE